MKFYIGAIFVILFVLFVVQQTTGAPYPGRGDGEGGKGGKGGEGGQGGGRGKGRGRGGGGSGGGDSDAAFMNFMENTAKFHRLM